MLTNTLSLDEEDAVQTELKALQEETVSSSWSSLEKPINPSHQLRAQGNAETPISLPNAPTTELVSPEQGRPLHIHQPSR